MRIIPEKITLVNQDDDTSCVLACIAMVSGETLQRARIVARNAWIYAPLNILQQAKVLALFNLTWMPVVDEQLHNGFVYILTVPSLNISSGQHSVVVDTRAEPPIVYDPQNGKEDKKFYSFDALSCYSYPVKIIDPYEEV